MDNILKDNFIEICKFIQRSYFAGFVTATAFLGLVLQAKSGSGSHYYTIPVLNITIVNSVVTAVYLLFFVYSVAGLLIFFSAYKYEKIKSFLSEREIEILETYPSIWCSNLAIKILVTLVIVLYLTAIFESISPDFSFFRSLTSASMMSAFYIISLFSSKPRTRNRKVTRSI